MSVVLDRERIYDAAELPQNSESLRDIVYVAFAGESFKDLSLLASLTGLRVLALRMCGLVSFPNEIFQLSNLESLDLTGNSFNTLESCERFSQLPKLRALNMSQNALNDINEAFKLNTIPSLKQLTLTDNICMSAHDAFNRIIKVFPTLVVLNEYIITAQHRAYLDQRTSYDTRGTVPLNRADDYIFYYVKYMHGKPAHRHLRRINTVFFCVNRVLRHHCAVTKIQSIFRGFLARKQYKMMKRAALLIEDFVRFWYFKRTRVATKIKRAFLHHQLKTRIRAIVSARTIQGFWRRYLDRRTTLTKVFQNVDGSCDVFLTQETLDVLQKICQDKGFALPPNATVSEYVVLRKGTPKKRPLPGSPFVFYNVEENILVRKTNHRKNLSPNSIWCGHDHSTMIQEKQVSKHGVNFVEKCPFSRIKFIPYQKPVRARLGCRQYPRILNLHFEKPRDLTVILEYIIHTKPNGVLLFPLSSLRHAAAQITIHSALRALVVRKRGFAAMKSEALERRAINAIRFARKTASIMTQLNHMFGVVNWYRNAPETNTYYVTSDFIKQISNIPVNHPFKFGFSADKRLCLADEEAESGNVLWQLFPSTKKIVYEDQRLSSMIKLEVTSSKAMTSMLDRHIPNKWLRRAGIVRLTFQTQEEAIKRITSFCYATGDFCRFMTEQQLQELCAATCIKNCWIGFRMRGMIRHEAAQKNRRINFACLLKRFTTDRKSENSRTAPVPAKGNEQKVVEKDVSIAQAIHDLRGDYMPWTQFEKIRRPYIAPEYKQLKEGDEEREITLSMKAMGVAHELDSEFQTIRLGDAEQKERKQPKQQNRAMSVLLPKLTYHEPPKPIAVTIESETERSFGRPLSDIRLDFSSTSSTFDEKLRALPDPETIGPMLRPRTATNYAYPAERRTISIDENSESQEDLQEIRKKRPHTAQNLMKPDAKLQTSLYPQKRHKNAQARPVTPRVHFKKDDNERSQTPQPLIAIGKEKNRDPSGIVKIDTKPQTKPEDPPKRARSPLNERILGDLKPKSERTAKSPQSTNEQLKAAIQSAFTKLVRLRQMGIDITQSFVVDDTLQRKRASTVQAQERQRKSRLEMRQMRQEAADATRERNAIERQELKEKAMEVKAKVQHLREVAARRAKTSHARRVNKYKKEKVFAQHFVSVSRQVAQVVETRHRKMEERKIFAGVQARAENARKESREMREKHKNTVKEMVDAKLDAARLDKKLLNDKRDILKQKIQARLQEILELKHQMKEAMAEAAELRKSPQFIYPNNKPTLETDEFEGAVLCIGEYVGSNLGSLEKRLLCDLISQALGPMEYCL